MLSLVDEKAVSLLSRLGCLQIDSATHIPDVCRLQKINNGERAHDSACLPAGLLASVTEQDSG